MAKSKTRLCRTGQLIVALFLGRLRPSKRLTSTKRGRPRLFLCENKRHQNEPRRKKTSLR